MPVPTPNEVKILPAYTLAEASRYIGVSESTLRTWFRGKPAISTKKGAFKRKAVKAILPTDAGPREPLSFLDLIIAHVLFSLRNSYKFPMKRVAKAKDYLASLEGNLAFLAHRDFFHDHADLYLGMNERLLTLTEQGQIVDKTILEKGLHQIIYGDDGFADRFFPKLEERTEQQEFAINPSINYGRLCIVRLGVSADTIAARYKAKEQVADIAQDYGATTEEVVEAIRWHDRLAA